MKPAKNAFCNFRFFFQKFKKLFGFVGNSHFRSLEKHKMEPTFVTPFEPTSIFNLHCEHSVILQKFSVMPCAASKDIMFSHYLSCYISTIPKCPRSHEKFIVQNFKYFCLNHKFIFLHSLLGCLNLNIHPFCILNSELFLRHRCVSKSALPKSMKLEIE